ncbi:discoidin domain-containing protein [Cohnella silvisoli]|uniref:Discoidin domain-containing protein n=1 Tax=Cohnella silvisoli TaxID=2873699 RepID=A0ABV1KMI6_9BACL|nr:discoidin domain-containing protein [Cohnella silvisoli]MCD9020636.1 discoidin domain-containing protein [Cohnella silvisoli]
MRAYFTGLLSSKYQIAFVIIFMGCLFLLPKTGYAVGGGGWTKLYSIDGTSTDSMISAGQTRGEQFYSADSFNSLRVLCPSYSNNIGSLTLKLYRWNADYATTVAGTSIASQTYTNFADNAWLQLNFATQASGNYLWVLSNPVETVGVWTYTASTHPSTAYLNGSSSGLAGYDYVSEVYDLGTAPNVVPSLREWTSDAGDFSLAVGSRIAVDSAYNTALADTANTFREDMLALTGLTLNVVTTTSPAAGDFYLTLNNTDSGIGSEGYIMQAANYVTIKANSAKGVFYGTRTALQILNQSPDKTSIPKGTARDYPAYKERGFMLDVARKYFTVDSIKDTIKFLSWHKMNDLHIHFSDNDAFRLVSTTYPGLAATQSYSHADLQDIQDFARKYQVTITPEIDLPGHAFAITSYLPSIKNQTWSDVIDLSLPDTFTFVNNLLDEFVPLFEAPDFHLGADETPNDARGFPYFDRHVDADTRTHNYALAQGYSTAGELYRKFINDYNTVLKNKGKKTRVWAWFDTLPGNIPISNDIVYDAWLADGIQSISQRGFQIINSSARYLYSVPGTDWQSDNVYLYQTWKPNMFDSFNTSNQLSGADPNILGVKFNNWNDISVAKGFTEKEIAKIVASPLRIVSEKTWGGPQSVEGYAAFLNRSALAGEPPGLITLGGNAPINLALTRPVTTSSNVNGNLAGMNAVDGAATTRWASAEGIDPQWIYVDLGTPSNFNRIKLNWETAYAVSYTVSVSNDAANWTTVYSTTSGDGGIDDVSLPTVSARYVRVHGTQRATAWGYSLWDLGVYYDLPAGNNYALNKTATASSVYPSSTNASNVLDGNEATRWSSNEGVDPQWINIDLGQNRTINRVRLNWQAAYAKSYKIQLSTDSVNWTDVYSTTTGNGGIDDIEFTAASARYVRMYGTERGTGWGYSLFEFGVYYDNPAQTNLALSKAATASGTYPAGNAAGNATDSSMATRWSSPEGIDPQWIYVDLGSVQSFNGVKLYWESAYGKTYKIQVSYNALSWTDVYQTVSGDGGLDYIRFPSVNARYVRMYGSERGTGWGYSLYSFNVYSN